ncbi:MULTISPECIES: hypothetical protein [Streptomyces]|nr:hypothetical protein [Streptomyces virginiae]
MGILLCLAGKISPVVAGLAFSQGVNRGTVAHRLAINVEDYLEYPF